MRLAYLVLAMLPTLVQACYTEPIGYNDGSVLSQRGVLDMYVPKTTELPVREGWLYMPPASMGDFHPPFYRHLRVTVDKLQAKPPISAVHWTLDSRGKPPYRRRHAHSQYNLEDNSVG